MEAYGCTLNRGEASEIEDLLRSRGWDFAPSAKDADIAILVACVVIESTERKMLRRLKALSSAPRLIVTGCLATARRDVAAGMAPSAEFVSPGDFDRLAEIVETVGDSKPSDYRKEEGYAIVPIATGCSGRCAYCITRLARGSICSRPASDIVSRIADLTMDGPREIRLTSQDTASYGADLGSDLAELLDSVCMLKNDFRIRLGMMNPFSVLPMLDSLIERYQEPRIFGFLHLPLQSASDRVLESMERRHTMAEFETVVSRMRSRMPELTLSTDVIAGYPGETEEDHEFNLSMIRRLRPDIVNVTRFSPRPGTKAAAQAGAVVGRIAKRRSRELTTARFEVSQEINEGFVGRSMTALATERGRESSTVLRNDAYKQIVVKEEAPLRRFYEVTIVEATPTYLIGRFV